MLHQDKSSSNGTAPGISTVLYDQDSYYEIVQYSTGAQIKHLTDNKCLYVDANTSELLSWECNGDSNMVFNFYEDSIYSYDHVLIKHDLSGLYLKIDTSTQTVETQSTGYPLLYREIVYKADFSNYLGLNRIKDTSSYYMRRLTNGVDVVSPMSSSYYYEKTFWRLIDAGGNKLRISSLEDGKCMYAESGTNDLKFWECWSDPNMEFYVNIDSGANYLYHDLTGQRVSVSSGSVGQYGDPLTFVEDDPFDIANMFYTSSSNEIKINNTCLDVYGNLSSCQLLDEQTFFFADNGNGSVKITTAVEYICMLGNTLTGAVSYGDCGTSNPENYEFELLYTTALPDEDLRIRHIDSGLCVRDDGQGSVALADCGSSNTKYTMPEIAWPEYLFSDITSSFVGVTPPRQFKVMAGGMCLEADTGVSNISRFNYCVADSEVDPVLVQRRNEQRYDIVDNGNGTVNLRRGDAQNLCVFPTVDDCMDVYDCYTTDQQILDAMEFIILDRYNGSATPNYKFQHVETGMCLTFVGTGANPDLGPCDASGDNELTLVEY